MPHRTLKSKFLRTSFVVGFPILLAIVIIFGSLVLFASNEQREETKEATGIDFQKSAGEMLILLAITFAILFIGFLLIIPGIIRKRR